MKAAEFSKCLMCGKGVLHASQPLFLRVKIEYHMVVGAAQRAVGLEQAFGPIAAALGPDEDLTRIITNGIGLVCGGCMIHSLPPFALLEATAAAEVQHG